MDLPANESHPTRGFVGFVRGPTCLPGALGNSEFPKAYALVSGISLVLSGQ